MQPSATWNRDQFLKDLEIQLSTLAAEWRDSDDTRKGEALIHQYQRILRAMILLGFRKWLDPDAELPDDYMPAEYLSGDFRKNLRERQFEPLLSQMHFLLHVNEELHTPLSAIRGYSHLLEEDGGLNERQHQFLQRIVANMDRMEQIMSSFDQFLSAERPAAEPESASEETV